MEHYFYVNYIACRNIKSNRHYAEGNRYYAEACKEWRSPSLRLRAGKAAQLRRNIATVASRWRHCANMTGPGIEPQTSHIDSYVHNN